jgi:hypothetical protein
LKLFSRVDVQPAALAFTPNFSSRLAGFRLVAQGDGFGGMIDLWQLKDGS